MNKKRIYNMVLAIVAGLLLLNLGCMLFPGTHAVSTIQYKVMQLGSPNAQQIELTLNQQGAEGWVYVDQIAGGSYIIFKK